jgi:hypothetical protein
MYRKVRLFGVFACATLALASNAFAQNGKVAAQLAASKEVKAAVKATGSPLITISGCVTQLPSNPFCKYVSMNGASYSAAVLSEVPLVDLWKYGSLASAPPIPANTSVFGYAVRLYEGAPSINCILSPVPVYGDIVVKWIATSQSCPKQ